MTPAVHAVIAALLAGQPLSEADFLCLLDMRSPETAALLAAKAREKTEEIFGQGIFIRGLIEISNICKNDCLYCGIRASNKACVRYRLSEEEILACCEEGERLGMRTFVLQGGEDAFFTDDRLLPLVSAIKQAHPDCALTLSLGERSYESYKALKEAGADRYLLRHETADASHYASLHPHSMSHKDRMQCLHELKSLGYQVGMGFMVGSPYQTNAHLAKDLALIQDFKPHMCGIGPFLPHPATPFAAFPRGDGDLTCYLLSVLRLMHPTLLLPATTALSSLEEDGREKGILAGANVVMPNLSPPTVRDKYELYEGKKHEGAEAAEHLADLNRRLSRIHRHTVIARGDYQTNQDPVMLPVR